MEENGIIIRKSDGETVSFDISKLIEAFTAAVKKQWRQLQKYRKWQQRPFLLHFTNLHIVSVISLTADHIVGKEVCTSLSFIYGILDTGKSRVLPKAMMEFLILSVKFI